MKVKNVSVKIISIGSIVVLPGECANVPEVNNNKSLHAIIGQGFLEIVDEDKEYPAQEAKSDEAETAAKKRKKK